MPKRKRGNTLEKWEVALIKAMLNRHAYSDQEILAYFTRPGRSINHARIHEIRTEKEYKSLKPASEKDLNDFLAKWSFVERETGLDPREDELLVKAREAMIAAVYVFNSAGLIFRTEIFIVMSMISWTYLFHAWFRREEIDYRYKEKDGSPRKTKEGADRYWSLSDCLKHEKCPISKGAVNNLKFILGLRHEIEHRSTNRIDDAVSAKLQACCLNFNDAIQDLFDPRYGIEQKLPIALQFVTFSSDQRAVLRKSSNLPQNIEAFIDTFEHNLSEKEYADQAYRYRVAFVPITSNRVSNADVAINFVSADSAEGRAINQVFLKEVDKKRYTATKIWNMMQSEGYPKFNKHAHTKLWKDLDAKNPKHGFGRAGDYDGHWVWYDKWIERVRAHCQKNRDRYR